MLVSKRRDTKRIASWTTDQEQSSATANAEIRDYHGLMAMAEDGGEVPNMLSSFNVINNLQR